MVGAVAEFAAVAKGVQEREADRAALDAAIARGLTDVENGRTRTVDDVFDRLEEKYRAMIQPGE